MSFLSFFSLAFFLGVLLAIGLNLAVDLGLWFLLLAALSFTVLRRWFHRNFNPGSLILVIYLVGLGWPTIFASLSERKAFSIFPIYSPIERKIEDLKLGLADSLRRDLAEPQSSLAWGMLFGSRNQNFDKKLLKDLRTTGTVHMVAVSGFNVSILVNILLNTAILLVSKVFILLGLLALFFYTLIVGFSASVLRALIMGLYLFVSRLAGRQQNLDDAFLFSGCLLLVINPYFLVDLGYQLSFLSMLGVIKLSPLFQRPLRRLPRQISAVIGATLGAQLMILPVSAYNFGQISLIAPLSNLLTFWTVPLIMLLTSLELWGNLIFNPLGLLFSLANRLLLSLFIFLVQSLANLPWAAVTF